MSIVLPSLIGANKPASGGAFLNEKSLSFDGTDDSLDVASTSDYAFGTSGFSIGFWFNPVGTNNSSGFGVNIFDMRSVTVNQAKPSLWMSSTGSGSILKYYAAGAYRTTFTGTINPGSWYHLLITNDGSNTKFYLNGNSTAIATGSDSTNYIAAGLRLGGYSGNAYYYNGLIDEFAIWNATLSGADSTAIYNSGVCNDLSEASSYDTDRTSNLIGWWRMGDGTEAGSGTTIFDMSTNSNNGTLINGPTFSTSVPEYVFNQYSVSFDGTDDSMDVGAVSDLNGSISSVTISAWFNVSAFGDAVISGGSSGSDRFYMQIYDSTTIRYGSGVGFDDFTVPTLSTGTWYHVALIHNGTSAALYLNNSQSSSGSQVVESPTANYGSSLKIGSYFSGSNYFQGLLDEVAVFDSALSASNITAIYNSGVPNDISSLSPVGWWRMGDNNGASGTTITDQGSGGNDGTLTNGPTFSTDVPS